MAHAISRIYATKADADSAIGDLGKHGFDTGNVFVVDPPAVPVDPSSPAGQSVVEQIADKIAKGFILKRDAKVYAKHVAKGAVFVTVYAPFGAGRKMTVFLDSHRPVDPGFPPPAQPRLRYDEATPLSCALGLPVLASHPTPCSAVLGLPAIFLLEDGPFRKFLRSPAPLSHLLNIPVMSASGASTSTSLGLQTLTAKGEPTSTSLGLPTLTTRGVPTSTSLGLPTVTAKGRPTSLGLPLLWR